MISHDVADSIESLINKVAVSMVQDSLNDLLTHASVDNNGTVRLWVYSREDVEDIENYDGSDEVILKIDIFDEIESLLAEGDDNNIVINKMKDVLEKWDK